MACRNKTKEFNDFINPPAYQPLKAQSLLFNAKGQNIGRVLFTEMPDQWLTKIEIEVRGQCPGEHGIHVHMYGDALNPQHGIGPDDPRGIDTRFAPTTFCPGRLADQLKMTQEARFLQCCEALGGHFNDDNFQAVHGGPNDDYGRRHIGDLGNVTINRGNIGFKTIYDRLIRLRGRWNVIGRSVVLHQNPDDLGRGHNPESLKNGSSGPPVACGLIERIN